VRCVVAPAVSDLHPGLWSGWCCWAARRRHETIRRALIVMASATTVAAIARLVAANEDTVRDVIHASTTRGWPVWTLTGWAAVPAASPTLTLAVTG
jgi:hypothetical protein